MFWLNFKFLKNANRPRFFFFPWFFFPPVAAATADRFDAALAAFFSDIPSPPSSFISGFSQRDILFSLYMILQKKSMPIANFFDFFAI